MREYRRTGILLLKILLAVVAVCAVALFGLYCWIHENGSLANLGMNYRANQDTGTAVEIDDSARRDGVFSIFVGATDEDGTRTDTMMVMVFDTEHHKADVINIPRDTLSDCSRKGAGRKINAAYAQGIDQTLTEISQVIGFRPDKYIIANFEGIAEIVDVIGGVDYDIPFDMSYHDPTQNLSIDFSKGKQHLNGKQVVEFLRWRHNDDGSGYTDGDVGRVEKLQKFLVTVGAKVLSPANLVKIRPMAEAVERNVDTDITMSQMVWLGMQAINMDMSEDVSMDTLIGDPAMISFGDSLWFYVVDEDMVLDQINKTYNPFLYDLTEKDFKIATPKTYGVRSVSWENAKADRYYMIEHPQKEKDDADTIYKN